MSNIVIVIKDQAIGVLVLGELHKLLNYSLSEI